MSNSASNNNYINGKNNDNDQLGDSNSSLNEVFEDETDEQKHEASQILSERLTASEPTKCYPANKLETADELNSEVISNVGQNVKAKTSCDSDDSGDLKAFWSDSNSDYSDVENSLPEDEGNGCAPYLLHTNRDYRVMSGKRILNSKRVLESYIQFIIKEAGIGNRRNLAYWLLERPERWLGKYAKINCLNKFVVFQRLGTEYAFSRHVLPLPLDSVDGIGQLVPHDELLDLVKDYKKYIKNAEAKDLSTVDMTANVAHLNLKASLSKIRENNKGLNKKNEVSKTVKPGVKVAAKVDLPNAVSVLSIQSSSSSTSSVSDASLEVEQTSFNESTKIAKDEESPENILRKSILRTKSESGCLSRKKLSVTLPRTKSLSSTSFENEKSQKQSKDAVLEQISLNFVAGSYKRKLSKSLRKGHSKEFTCPPSEQNDSVSKMSETKPEAENLVKRRKSSSSTE